MKALLKVITLSLFLVGQSVAMDTQQAPVPTVQQQIEIREATECEQKVSHYREKVNEHPNSAYYKFMYKLWNNRCPDK